MFQDTRSRSDSFQDQDSRKREQGPKAQNLTIQEQHSQMREQEQKAQNLTDEVRSRMLRDADTKSYESQAQMISGRLEETLVRERVGASAEQVRMKAEQQAMPEVDRELGQLQVPLAEDTRWMVRDNVRRAVMERASALQAERTETLQVQPDRET